MNDETILTDAILVLPDTTLNGTLVVRGGCIADVQPGRSTAPRTVPAAMGRDSRHPSRS